MSVVLIWFIVSAPGSSTTCEPMLSRGCQIANTAPVGSWRTAMRPKVMTSKGSVMTFAPRSFAFAAAASASSTVT